MEIMKKIWILLEIQKVFGRKLNKSQEKIAWNLYLKNYPAKTICKYL